MSRATRRNISITSQEVEDILDSVANVSHFIQEAVVFYHQNLTEYQDAKYVTEEEFEKRMKGVESKCSQLESITNEMIEMMFQLKSNLDNTQ